MLDSSTSNGDSNGGQKTQRSAVSQWIKNKIKNEGIQARNIIKYNVPIENVHGARQSSTTQSSPAKLRMTVTPNRPKPQFVEGTYHTSSWSQLTSPRCNRTLTNSTSATSPSPSLQDRATFSPNSSSTSLQDSSFHKAISNRSMARPPVGSRNAVTARTENEYRARYWGQMLDTLRRTIDEIYSACEADESEVECKEVIMILEHSKQDFRSLIEKMNLLRQYERADDEHRPNALAWDERTTLPGKPIMRQVLASAALAVANVDDSPYISIPLVNFTAGSDLAEASGETESDHLGPGQGLASWHLVVPKHCAKVQRLITDPTQQLTFTTLSNAATPTNRSLPPGLTPSTKYPPSIRSESEMTRFGYSSAKDALFDYTGDDDDLLGSHEDVEFEMDGAEGEDEAEVVDGLSVTNLSADREPDLGNATSSCCFSEGLPEDLDNEDECDDTTLSRDLRQLDEAIANVTTAERVLTDQLGRAQCAEAALRRRLLARDETDVDKEYSRSGSFLPSKLTASNKPAGSDLLVLRMGKLAVPRRKPAPISGRVTDPSSGDDRADHDACSRQSVSLRVNCSTPATISSTTLVSSTNLRTVATFTDADHEVHWCGCHCHSRSAGDEANRVPIISSPHFSWSRKADGSSDVIAPEVAHPCGSEREMRISPASAMSQPKSIERSANADVRQNTHHIHDPAGPGDVLVPSESSAEIWKPRHASSPARSQQSSDILLNRTSSLGSGQHLLTPVASVNTAKGLLLLSELNAKSRVPGHGIQMHEKFSSRSRRTTNSMQELEQKQTRARILRQQHLLERSERVHELSKKVEEVHMHKRLLLHQRRSCLERRLHAAERKRKAELERRISKAHDEETKGREIAFIQTLEAEQKQHSILTKHEESRARLDELAAERRRRLEEKLGREEAAKGRRRALEASRRARLDALQARWEIRAQQLASRAEYLEHCRRAAAKAKEQHREVKMANLEEQQRTHIEQLRTKIQRKQEESERRHQESLREISRKAFEMSVLTHTGEESSAAAGIEPYPIQKWCRACQVKIVSEVSLKSHLHGKRHQKAFLEANENRPIDRSELEAFNLLHLVDAPSELLDPPAAAEQERLRIRRRRARKLRQRMNQRAAQFSKELEQLKSTIPESPNRSQIQKLVKEARRFVSLPDSGPWVTTRVQAMEKTLNAFLRCLSVTPKDKLLPQSTSVNGSVRFGTAASVDQIVCTHLGLLPVLTSLLSLMCSQRPSGTQLVPDRTYQLAAEVLRAVCQSCSEACRRMVCGNDVAVLVDCLVARFSPPVTSSRQLGTMVTKDDPLDGDSSYTVAVNPCTLAVMHSFTCIINQVVEDWYSNPPIAATSSVDIQRIQDLLGYIVSSGLVDLLAARLSSPRQANWLLRIGSPGKNGPNQFIEQSQQITLATIALLTCLVRLLGCIPSACPTKARSTQTVHTATHQQSEVSSTTGSSVVHVSAVQLSVDETSTYSVSSASRATDASTPPTSSSPRGNNVCVRGTSASSRDTVMGSSTCSYQATTADSTTPITADSTKLLETVIDTEMFGLIPLLYGLLLDPSSRPTQPGMMDTSGGKNEQRKVSGKPTTPGSARSADRKSKLGSSADTKTSAEQSAFRNPAVGQIALQALRLINSFAMVNRPALQTIVSGELTSLLIRHILLALLTRCLCESSSNTVNVPSGLEVDAKVPRKRKVTAESKLSASTTPSRRRVDDTEDLRELIPSGARAAVARAASNTAKSGIDLYGLPDWANENVTPESQPSTVKPVTNLDHMLPSQQLTDAVLHEAILCAGHVCALNFDNQTSLQTGPPPTLLQRLVALPFDYFSQRPLTDILYPTLIAFCYEHPTNSAVLEAELSPTLLANYIEERLLERTMDALSDTDTRILASSEATDLRFRFEYRFPVSKWETAKAYFVR